MEGVLENHLRKRASERMELICDQLEPGRPIWDLCCDHGMIGLLAFSRGLYPQVHLIDRAAAVIAKLRENINLFPPKEPDKVFVYCQDAACANISSACSNIILAGVGAKAIIKILKKLLPKLSGNHRLVLGAHSQVSLLESFIKDEGLSSPQTYELVERGRQRRIYVIDFQGLS